MRLEVLIWDQEGGYINQKYTLGIINVQRGFRLYNNIITFIKMFVEEEKET